MVVGWEVRLGLLIVLLSLQLVGVASDFGLKPRYNSEKKDNIESSQELTNRTSLVSFQITSRFQASKQYLNRPGIRKLSAPLLIVAVVVVLVSLAFSNAGNTYHDTNGICNRSLDADISGDGVRASIWVQVGVLIFIGVVGLAHPFDTGIKEVTGGLILTHVSLVIALFVQMRRGTLSSVDAAIGTVILDAQNVALQIPFSTKETLAARWQVLLVIPTQLLGLIVIPILVAGLERGQFTPDGCGCLYVFWWSWISDCGDSYRDDDGLACFYVYYSLRWIMTLRSSCKAMFRTGRWHRAEKCTHIPHALTDEAVTELSDRYTNSSATVSYSCLIYALYSITSMVVAEIIIEDFELHASSSVYSVGQIIAIVIARSTILRALWVFIGMFNDAVIKGFPDLVFTLLRFVCVYLGGSEAYPSERDRESEFTKGLRPLPIPPRSSVDPPLTPARRPAQLMMIEAEEGDAEDHSSVSDMSEDGEARPPSGASSPASPTPLAPPGSLAEGPEKCPAHHFVETGPRWRRDAAIAGLAAPQVEQHGAATHEESAPALTRPISLPQQQPQPQPPPQPSPQPPHQPSPQPQHEHRPHTPPNRPDIFHSPPHRVTPHHMRPHRDTQSYRFTFRNPFRLAGRNFGDSDDDDEDDDSIDTSSWMTEVA